MADSVLMTILEQVQMEIQGLNLLGIDADSVHIVKVFTDTEELLPTLPGVLVGPADGESVPQGGGTNSRVDVGYPVAIGIFAADGDSQSDDFDRNLLWRERIRSKFVDQRLAGAPSVYTCRFEPREIVDRKRWLSRGLWSSSFGLRFLSREPRV
ncbi:MAG: hypothetical protein RIC55_21365 [Pirellulaceae bacterium]